MDIPFKKVEGGITLEVKVQPRASRAGVAGVEEGRLKVRLTSPPVEGAANKQLAEVLSHEFGVSKGAVEILRGDSSRVKLVLIRGVSQPGRQDKPR